MDKYSESFISSSYNYLYNLQYFAKDNKKALSDLFDIRMLLDVYGWCSYQEYDDSNLKIIEKLINNIILKNPELEFVKVTPNTYYKNVNIPQTIWTWQRVYDYIFDDADIIMLLGEDGSELIGEDNYNLTQE